MKYQLFIIIFSIFIQNSLFSQAELRPQHPENEAIDLNDYLSYSPKELDIKVKNIYESMNLKDSFSLSNSLDTYTLIEQYSGISIDSIIQKIDWNEVTQKVDWDEIFEELDWNEMMSAFCVPQDSSQTAATPFNFDMPASSAEGDMLKGEDYMDCFSALKNPMKMMSVINMPCLLQVMQKIPLDSLGNNQFSPLDLTDMLQGQGNSADREMMCTLMACMNMNKLFKNVDWNCLMSNYDFNQVLKHWKMDEWIAASDSLKTMDAKDYANKQMENSPIAKAFMKAIHPDSLMKQMEFAYEDFFDASTLRGFQQNFYDAVFKGKLGFNPDKTNLRKLIELVAAFMSNHEGETKELKYFIAYFLTHLDMQEDVLKLNFTSALERQKILKDIMIQAHQQQLFQNLWKDEQMMLNVLNKEKELQQIGSIFQMMGHSLAELGQHTASLDTLKIAATLKKDFINRLGDTPKASTYLAPSFSITDREVLIKRYAISQDAFELVLKDLLGESQHPKAVRKLIAQNNIEEAVAYYLIIKDLLLEAGSKNQVIPSFEIPNELADKLFEFEYLKKIYANINQLLQAADKTEHPDYSYYQKAVPSLTKLKTQQDLVLFYNEIGGTYFDLKNYEAALKNLNESLKLLKEIENLDYVLFTLPGLRGIGEAYLNKIPAYISVMNNVAQIHLSRKDNKKAIGFLEEEIIYLKDLAKQDSLSSTAKAEMMDIENDLFLVYNVLGTAYLQNKNYEQALATYQKCNKIAEANQKDFFNYQAQLNLGNYWKTKKDNTQALSHYKAAKTAATALNYPYGVAAAHVHIGSILLAKEQKKEAFEQFKKSEAIAKPLRQFDILYWINTHKGHQYNKEENFEQALFYFEEGIRLVEDRLLINLSGEISRQLVIANGFECYQGAVKSALNLDKKELAFQYVQQSKARTFNESVGNTYLQSNQISKDLKDRQNDILIAINKTKQAAKQDSLLRALEIVKAEIRTANPNIKNLFQTSFVSLAEVQKTLEKEEAFIEYFAADSLHAFLISSTQVTVFKLGSSKKIMSNLMAFQQLIAISKPKPDNRQKRQLGNLNDKIYKQLFQPLKTYLTASTIRQLIIAPDAAIYAFPFEILRTKKLESNYSYLIDDFEIRYSPSATAYNTALRQHLAQTSTTKDLLIIAKSDFSEYDKSYHLPPLQPRWHSIYNKFEQADILLNEQAQAKNLKHIKNYQHLYFYTHGILNDSIPELSFLALSPKPLFLVHTFDLSLNCKNIVLATCNSGRGQFQRGSGLIGFTRSLMNVGAQSVTLSLWSPLASETNLFFETYYTHIAAHHTPHQALHLTKLALRNSEQDRLNSPYFWGAFVLYGAGE